MPQVESSGAKISYTIAGHGPTLVLVHGSVLGHQNTWMAVRQALEQRFTSARARREHQDHRTQRRGRDSDPTLLLER